MKFKALRNKKTKEFVEIQQFNGMNVVFTSELPNPQPMTATMDGLKEYFDKYSPIPDIDINDFELVTFDLIEESVD